MAKNHRKVTVFLTGLQGTSVSSTCALYFCHFQYILLVAFCKLKVTFSVVTLCTKYTKAIFGNFLLNNRESICECMVYHTRFYQRSPKTMDSSRYSSTEIFHLATSNKIYIIGITEQFRIILLNQDFIFCPVVKSVKATNGVNSFWNEISNNSLTTVNYSTLS